MATGYTACVEDGVTFEEFVWKCARAFGANIMMRDDPQDAKIKQYEPDSYHMDRIKEARSRLAELETMTIKQAEVLCKTEFSAAMVRWNEARDRMAALATKYNTMIGLVSAWVPPTKDHNGLKEFMLKQLADSLEWDCHSDEYQEKQRPVLKPAGQWISKKIEETKRDITYHTTHYEAEVKSTNERNAWNNALHASVPQP